MDTSQKQQLLDNYGHAQADSMLLNILLQSLSADTKTPSGMDATILRSINRAEQEMHNIKTQYEEDQ